MEIVECRKNANKRGIESTILPIESNGDAAQSFEQFVILENINGTF
jgi:hypothetical protein